VLEVLDVCVGARIEAADVPVALPPHDERRAAVIAEYLEDLAVAAELPDLVAADDEPIAGCRTQG
jgi:hypothetical protein